MSRTPPKNESNDSTSGTQVKLRNKRPRIKSNSDSSIEISPDKNDEITKHQCITPELIREIIRSELQNLLSNDMGNIIQDSIRSELKDIIEELGSMKRSVKFISKQYDDMHSLLEERSKQINQLQKENNSMQPIIKELNFRLTQMEQHARSCNIEIISVPEFKSENLNVITMQLCKSVSCPLKDSDIIMATRVAKQNTDGKRPRSIIVKVISPSVRDEILAAVIKFNKANATDKLSTAHLGIGGDKKPVYVAEHLTVQNRALHQATRLAAKEKNYKFVWVRNGRIFAKKNETSERLLIKDKESLQKLLI